MICYAYDNVNSLLLGTYPDSDPDLARYMLKFMDPAGQAQIRIRSLWIQCTLCLKRIEQIGYYNVVLMMKSLSLDTEVVP